MKHYKYNISNKHKDWTEILPVIFKDKKIHLYFKKWLLKYEGVQEFPNNPLNPENWEENN